MDILLIGVSCLYSLIMLALVVLFLIDLAFHIRQVAGFWKFGLTLAGISLGLGIAILAALPQLMHGLIAFIMPIVLVLGFAVAMLFACVGMYSCRRMGQRDLALVKRSLPGSWAPRRANWAGLAVSVAAITGSCVVLSCVLFKLTNPRISRMMFKIFEVGPARTGQAGQTSVALTLTVLAAAWGEEVIFRLGIQSFLARHLKLHGGKYWLAILITAALWTLGHAGMMEPAWVKFAQIFPLGVGLGMLFWQYGVEAAILAHGTFNVVMMLLAEDLILLQGV